MSELRVECGHQPHDWSCIATPRVSVLIERGQQDPLVAQCAQAARTGDLDDVLDALLRGGWRELPDFAAVDRQTRRVLARGTASADAQGPGPSGRIRNTGRAPWNDLEVDPSVQVVVLHGDPDVPPAPAPAAGVAAAAPAVQPTPPAAPSPLPSTPVPPTHSGFPQPEPASATPAAPPASDGAEDEPDQADADEPEVSSAPPAPAPVVMAIRCPDGHPNAPHARTCRLCGQEVPPQAPTPMPRPALGVLVASTGDRVTLDRDVIVGRSPRAAEGTSPESQPHLLRVASPGNDVSRNHVRVHLDGWQVKVSDLGSTNGTVVTWPDSEPIQLRQEAPRVIEPGTRVSLAADISFTFQLKS